MVGVALALPPQNPPSDSPWLAVATQLLHLLAADAIAVAVAVVFTLESRSYISLSHVEQYAASLS